MEWAQLTIGLANLIAITVMFRRVIVIATAALALLVDLEHRQRQTADREVHVDNR